MDLRKILAVVLFSVFLGSCGGIKGEKYDVGVTVDLSDVPNEHRKTYEDAVRQRLVKYGVDEENIQTKATANEVNFKITSFPSIDPELRGLAYFFQSSVCLEFHETYSNEEIFSLLEKINQSLRDTTASSLSDSIQKANPLFRILLPNIDQSNRLVEGPILGFVKPEEKDKAESLLNKAIDQGLLPGNLVFVWSEKPDKNSGFYGLYALRTSPGTKHLVLKGDKIESAEVEQMENYESKSVTLKFNKEGSDQWAALTKKNINKAIAIVYDNKVFSAPIVMGEITGGVSQITGDFTNQELDMMVQLLNATSLPGKPRVTDVKSSPAK